MDPIYEAYLNEANTIDVFRIEHIQQGKGPYHAGYQQGEDFAKQFPISIKYNPDPNKDPILQPAIKNGVFGFISILQMKRWFTGKGIKFLVDTGEFHVIKKTVPASSVVSNDVQAVVDKKAWNKAKAKKVKI